MDACKPPAQWLMVCLSLLPRSLQGDLPRGTRLHLLALGRAVLRQAPGGGRCAEHGLVVGGAELHLPPPAFLQPLAAAATGAAATQLPADATAAPVSRVC